MTRPTDQPRAARRDFLASEIPTDRPTSARPWDHLGPGTQSALSSSHPLPSAGTVQYKAVWTISAHVSSVYARCVSPLYTLHFYPLINTPIQPLPSEVCYNRPKPKTNVRGFSSVCGFRDSTGITRPQAPSYHASYVFSKIPRYIRRGGKNNWTNTIEISGLPYCLHASAR